MLHWKSYAGSIVLAGLLLQGCGGSSDAQSDAPNTQSSNTQSSNAQLAKSLATTSEVFSTFDANSTEYLQAKSDLTLKISALDNPANPDMQAYVDLVLKEISSTNRAEAYPVIAQAMMSSNSSAASNAPQRGLLKTITSPVTDKIKDGLVNVLDTNAGNAVTGAAFDVVLNSDGVTVAMLDLARNSDTVSQVMVDALSANWQLTEKMCPMLRENKEFGEKFTALAEEKDIIAKFFFERIDANMYGCLTDAMLLSNKDAQKGEYSKPVSHSTNGYMALLMDRYATDYFIAPTGSNDDRRNDKFVSLLLDTGAVADYNATSKTFENHGDGNELTNEKFFYSLFKTPATTEAFVSAMDKVDETTRTMLMDNIFLGTQADKNDTLQGELNIIAIGSSMYDGIYGEKGSDGIRTGDYGFGAYTSSFIGFAGLIPGDRYLTYAKAFINAGYEYAKFHGIDVWSGVSDAIVSAWNSYTTPDANTTASNAPSRSAGRGVIGSEWVSNATDLLWSAYDNFDITISWSGLYDAITGDKAIMDEIADQTAALKDSGHKAYHTLLDGRDENNNTVYPTEISNGLVNNDTVYGLHGLVELAMQEDMYYIECGNRSTDYVGLSAPTCENNASYTIDDAKAAFTLPPFADLTWSFGYNVAKDGAVAYYNNQVDASWFADLSSNELIREYFYPDANNTYIPSSLLAIDWLTLPANYANTNLADTDYAFDFNSGYFDVYLVSKNDNLINEINLPQAAEPLKTITMEKVDMGSDSIIAVDENGVNLDGLYVYKIRVVSPADTEAVLAYVAGLGDSALNAIGIDTTNASNVDTTTVATAN